MTPLYLAVVPRHSGWDQLVLHIVNFNHFFCSKVLSHPANLPRSPSSECCQSKRHTAHKMYVSCQIGAPASSFLNQMSRRRCASRLKPRRSSKCQEFTLSGWQYASTRCSFFCAKASRFFSIAQRHSPCNVFSKEKSAGLTIS